MSKEEILQEFQSWLSDESFKVDRTKFDHLKDAFNAEKAKTREAQLEQLKADGGEEADFEYKEDSEDVRFKELLAIYHDKRKQAEKQREDQENANLSEKQALVDELQELIKDEENIGKAYKRFNAIKQKWNEIGPTPTAKRRELQTEYSRLIELFYYNINIYRELQINDLKKNQELKKEMIEKIKLLSDEKSINQVDFLIHQYLDEWDEIGPTFKEEWEAIRDEFRTEVGKVFDRIRDHRKSVKEEHQQNYEAKEKLVEKVKEYAEKSFEDVIEVQKMSKEVIGIQKEWKKLGFAGRGKNDRIWADFRAACDEYFGKRDELMEESSKELKKVREAKKALIDRAKEIYESDELNDTANELKGMQRKWKDAGKLLPHEEYKLFKEFRKYCDDFFKRKKKQTESLLKEAKDNLHKKEEFLMKMNKAIEKEIEKKGEALIDEWREEWAELGDVPNKMRGKVEKSFENTLGKAYKALGISASEVEEKRFESKLESLSSSNRADDALSRERYQIIQKIKEAQTNLAQEESKLDFFKYSGDDNPLKQELLQRIDTAQQAIVELKEKKKRIDLTIKGLNQEEEKEEEAVSQESAASEKEP